MKTTTRLLAYLTQHGPIDYYQILAAMKPTSAATVGDKVRALLEAGEIEEIEVGAVVGLRIKDETH